MLRNLIQQASQQQQQPPQPSEAQQLLGLLSENERAALAHALFQEALSPDQTPGQQRQANGQFAAPPPPQGQQQQQQQQPPPPPPQGQQPLPPPPPPPPQGQQPPPPPQGQQQQQQQDQSGNIVLTPQQLQQIIAGNQLGNAAGPANSSPNGLGGSGGPASREQVLSLSADPEAFRKDFYSANSVVKQFLRQGNTNT